MLRVLGCAARPRSLLEPNDLTLASMIRRLLDFEEGIEGLQLQVDPASVQRVPSGFPTKPSKLV